MPNSLTYQQIDKIGNTLVYFANNVGELSKTKILKLLFLIEEKSIQTFGVPFFGVDFKVWKFGPVIQDVYVDLSEASPGLFSAYIKKDSLDSSLYIANATFNDDEFSDNDIFLLEKIREFARHKTAKDLVDFTHDKNSLWRKTAMRHGVLAALEAGAINSTEYTIDFGLLFEKDPEMFAYYLETKENRDFINSIKQ